MHVGMKVYTDRLYLVPGRHCGTVVYKTMLYVGVHFDSDAVDNVYRVNRPESRGYILFEYDDAQEFPVSCLMSAILKRNLMEE